VRPVATGGRCRRTPLPRTRSCAGRGDGLRHLAGHPGRPHRLALRPGRPGGSRPGGRAACRSG
jgi:hypothetical protein